MMSALLETIGALALLGSFAAHLSPYRTAQGKRIALRLKLLLAKFYRRL
ncbi:hypothetical protein [Paraburkholderia phenazinium]|jgi:hypothetical protein|uniref:Uncharacterized protein n=1 Tax=Paraburkholderia phenazinium TaxID=60549 RepID=A0A1N6FDZ9_9BURK|nr:hypothetical protein [Paraburkholderia phenazinium]SIN93511.1 hypothetical protein SAMN05444165_0149 [Paraburkholderia phenazinium]